MTPLVRRRLAELAAFVADLKERVRVAVAGELSRAVGDAVRDVVGAALAGRVLAPPRPAPRGRWGGPDDWDRPHDPWADEADDGDDPDDAGDPGRPTPAARAAVALAAGAAVARWWAGRAGGGLLAAAGLGLGVGLLGLLGGALAGTAVAVVAAAADVLTATAALGAGAARLGRL